MSESVWVDTLLSRKLTLTSYLLATFFYCLTIAICLLLIITSFNTPNIGVYTNINRKISHYVPVRFLWLQLIRAIYNIWVFTLNRSQLLPLDHCETKITEYCREKECVGEMTFLIIIILLVLLFQVNGGHLYILMMLLTKESNYYK